MSFDSLIVTHFLYSFDFFIITLIKCKVLEKKTLVQDLDSAATKEYEAILEKNKIALKQKEDLLIKLEKVTEKYISLKVKIHGKCNIFLEKG